MIGIAEEERFGSARSWSQRDMIEFKKLVRPNGHKSTAQIFVCL